MYKTSNAKKTSLKVCWLGGVLPNVSNRAPWLFLLTLQKVAPKCSSDRKTNGRKYSCPKHLKTTFLSSMPCCDNISKPVINKCICTGSHDPFHSTHQMHTHDQQTPGPVQNISGDIWSMPKGPTGWPCPECLWRHLVSLKRSLLLGPVHNVYA